MTQAVTTDSLQENSGEFLSIEPALVLSHGADFDLYLKQGDRYALYACGGELFTQKHRDTLDALGIDCLYIAKEDRPSYQKHVEKHLGDVLNDESLPLPTRAKVFSDAAQTLTDEIFEKKLPPSTRRDRFNHILTFVTQGVSFLTLENSLKNMASIIAHDYSTFSHSVHVFIYSQLILQTYGFDDKNLVQFGLGAILHDIGKMYIDDTILNKPGPLTWEEREAINEHPILGAGACTIMPLSQDALNCVLFHHEKLDGSGYPCGLTEEDIPLPVRAVTIADIYDAISSNRPYASAQNPFQVLRTMKNEMGGQIDLNVFARFVRLLSGANML